MAQLTAFGGKSKTIFLNEAESHKLHLAFEVAAGVTVKRGMPLKLNSAGLLVNMAGDGSDAHLRVGYSIHNGVAGDEVTLACRGYAVIFATAKTALNPGAVAYVGQDSADADYSSYNDVVGGTPTAVTADTMNGLAIDVATAEHDLIRVILM